MKIIDPRVEIITEQEPLKRIELCGRVCYKSEDRIVEGSAEKFVGSLIKRGHTSVLEHSHIIIASSYELESINRHIHAQIKNFNGALVHAIARMGPCDSGFPTMNVRDYLVFFPDACTAEINLHHNAPDYMTVRFVCDRAIANELVRHRVFSFSQESTRYVNYKDGIEFIRPLPFEWAKAEKTSAELEGVPCGDYISSGAKGAAWKGALLDAESHYRMMIDFGCAPQEARSVLPLSTKTELIMTGTHSQWAAMLKLRLDKASHPQMRYLMGLLVRNELFPKNRIEVNNEQD